VCDKWFRIRFTKESKDALVKGRSYASVFSSLPTGGERRRLESSRQHDDKRKRVGKGIQVKPD